MIEIRKALTYIIPTPKKQSTLRYIFILLFYSSFTDHSFAQAKDIWVRYYDTASDMSGYKDLKGNIKIPARFQGFAIADSFYNIIAAGEMTGRSYVSYYLLKDGRRFGRDSVYTFDFTYDCESEGKILFKDKKRDRVGFFNSKGMPIIPAIYNTASRFRNGMAVALINAKRQCWDKNSDTLKCEHLGWSGGKTVIINEKNELLADSVTTDLDHIYWYSLKINDANIDTSICVSIQGTNGNTYSFVDHQKEFTKWYHTKFLPALNAPGNDKLKKLLFPQVTFWIDGTGWISLANDEYLRTYPTVITKQRFAVNSLKQLSIHSGHLNELIFESKPYRSYLDACGAHNADKYPVFEVLLTYYKKREKELTLPPAASAKGEPSAFVKEYEMDQQEHFEFIRTAEGYRLFSVSY